MYNLKNDAKRYESALIQSIVHGIDVLPVFVGEEDLSGRYTNTYDFFLCIHFLYDVWDYPYAITFTVNRASQYIPFSFSKVGKFQDVCHKRSADVTYYLQSLVYDFLN